MDGGFVRHRGLIAFAAGGAMAEAVLLSFLAPSARPLAPQVTALPPLAAYHDLRWLFAFNQPWLGFTGVLLLLVVARSAADAAMVMLAWPRGDEHSLRPRPGGCRTCIRPAPARDRRPAGGTGRRSATLCPVTRTARLQWWRRP